MVPRILSEIPSGTSSQDSGVPGIGNPSRIRSMIPSRIPPAIPSLYPKFIQRFHPRIYYLNLPGFPLEISSDILQRISPGIAARILPEISPEFY